MRHNKKFNHLGRTASHRSAMLSNICLLYTSEVADGARNGGLKF